MYTTKEKIVTGMDGYLAIVCGLGFGALALVGAANEYFSAMLIGAPLALLFLSGLCTLEPNQAAVLTLFGAYHGTLRTPGLRWVFPLYHKTRVSLRANSLNMEKLKVNDKRGNPVEIAAAVVWKIEDSARAVFDVEDYQAFVRVQAEAALRHVVTEFNYDHGEDENEHEMTLMNGGEEFLRKLAEAVQVRTAAAGICVPEARLTHLAYAPEIAGVMLRRQQAEAVIAARKKIVSGAVGMVELALKQLSEKQVVQLDDERKAAMVSNLLVVLCADREAEPVINTGTLYN
ncbi:SPFH domain-containing protein [Massilia sp. W12]|uniref:SPFH domain-containing protein n=1 Tax=Massilia sp. W12 TaxID=3126507 RepID=UPI0030CF258C